VAKKKKEDFIIKKACINKANNQKNISIPKWFESEDNLFKISIIKKKK